VLAANSPNSTIDHSDKIFVSQTNPAPSPQQQASSLAAGTENNSDRINELEQAKAQLQERRTRLLALQHLDAEEERINRELAALQTP
jgi:DNA-binding FadR family transcriptional regulator